MMDLKASGFNNVVFNKEPQRKFLWAIKQTEYEINKILI